MNEGSEKSSHNAKLLKFKVKKDNKKSLKKYSKDEDDRSPLI